MGFLREFIFLIMSFKGSTVASYTIFGNSSLGRLKLIATAPQIMPLANNGSRCHQQTQRFLQDLDNLHLWAVKMHDASGKTASGLLNGNVHAPGDFWQCIQISEQLEGPFEEGGGRLRGKYCQIDAYLEVNEPETLDPKVAQILDSMLSHHAVKSSYNDEVKFFPSFTPITWGFCMPDSCSHTDLNRAIVEAFQPLNDTFGLKLRFKSSHQSCDVDRVMSFYQGKALPVIIFLWTILGVSVVGALLETFVPPREPLTENDLQNSGWFKLITAFSLKRNWNTLIQMDMDADDISCVHGIRFIFSMTIYLLHRGVFAMFVPFTNRTEIAQVIEGEWTMIFRAFWNNVDTFVVLSGLLTSYFSVKKLQQGRSLNIWIMYLQRYYKFTPMYVITALILRNLAIEMRTGPNALRVVKHFVLACGPSFWKTFIYIGNMDGMDDMCFPPAHQLITDMQMYLVAPAVVILMWRFGKNGVVTVLGLIGLLTVYKGYVVYVNNLGTLLYYGVSLSEMLATANQMYLNPLHRLTPYLFGMILGYIIRIHGQNINLTKERVYIGSCIAGLAAYYSFFAMKHVSSRTYVFDPYESAFFGMVQPILWSSAISWLIFICQAGKAEWVNMILSWKGFIIFSRLSYSFYLTQLLVMFFGIAGNNTSEFMRMHQLVSSFIDFVSRKIIFKATHPVLLVTMVDLNELFVVILMSVTFTLLFLLPLGELHQIFDRKPTPVKKD